MTSLAREQTMGEYELRVVGHLDERWSEWFAPLTIRHDADGTTRLVGPVPDQAALYGLIRKASDLGLALVSVSPLPWPPVDASADGG
jgi:hypothetical protein